MDSILFALLLSAGAVPFLPRTAPGWRRFTFSLMVFGLAWLCATILEKPMGRHETVTRPVAVRHDGYVGSGACRSCHREAHDSWHASYHRTMTQIAGPQTIGAKFDGQTVTVDGRDYRFFRKRDEYWVEYEDQVDVQWRHKVERRILMTTGSHHYQVYWYSRGERRLLAHIPVVYQLAEQRWIPRQSAFVVPTECGQQAYLRRKGIGQWNYTCIRCHATHGRLRGSENTLELETDVGEFGIACEACHGPGAAHIKANRNPFRRLRFYGDDEPDWTIKNPGRLDHRRESAICGQCHSAYLFKSDEAVRQWNEHGFAFRPGDELGQDRVILSLQSESHPVVQARLKNDPDFLRHKFWPDGMVRVAGREYNGLLKTACYQRGRMSCTSCHAMHQTRTDARSRAEWADDQLRFEMQGNQACLQCHPAIGADVSGHTHHSTDSAGSSCYNCHMPHTSYGLLKGVRSHQITSPRVDVTLQSGRPGACNLCHLDRTLEWTSRHLADWYGHDQPPLSEDHKQIAASLKWMLEGNAAQRILVASAMGWESAQEASGNDWMAPLLAQLLDDPYDAIRIVAHRSLTNLPGFARFDYDFLQPPQHRRAAAARAVEAWRTAIDPAAAKLSSQLLFNPDGSFREDLLLPLLRNRDSSRIIISE